MSVSTTPVAANSSSACPDFKNSWKDDLISGLLVSLIALPLCLGIAMASGFPAFGGVITAIVGGLIVAPLCGSVLTIKGPAAGLIAIAIASFEALGYPCTLAVIVIASALQMLFAMMKLGRYVDYFPASVVHGMLAAIGIIIFSKQIHPLLGVKPIAKAPIDLLLEIPHSLVVMNPEIALVGVTAVLIVIFATKIFGRYARYLPGPLLAVLAGIAFCLHFDFLHAHQYTWYALQYSLDDKYLVNLPQDFFSGVTFPDFSKITSTASIQFILMFALIGSLESLLTAKAVDSLDPYRRSSNMNKDLMAVGFGNFVCGLIGGLPMISEVVRSCANISYGAKTRWANFFHGAFLLAYALVLSQLIHLIPIAALAGVLCVTGYRLSSPQHFHECREIGKEQLIVFVVTIAATLFTDLLVGVFVGIIAQYIACWMLGTPVLKLFASVKPGKRREDGSYEMILPESCIFGNVIGFRREVDSARDATLVLDFSRTKIIDHTFMKEVRALEREAKSGERPAVILIGFERLIPVSKHETASRSHSMNKIWKKALSAY